MAAKVVDGKSRRRVPRRNLDGLVGVLCKGKYAVNHSYQIGEGGMMISCPEALVAGNQMVVSFVLNLGSMIVVRATVRSVIPAQNGKPQRYGVEFMNLAFNFKREIRNFVAAATHDDEPLEKRLSDGRHGF